MDFIYLVLARDHVSVLHFFVHVCTHFADSMLVCALADSYVSALRRPISNGE